MGTPHQHTCQPWAQDKSGSGNYRSLCPYLGVCHPFAQGMGRTDHFWILTAMMGVGCDLTHLRGLLLGLSNQGGVGDAPPVLT
jgi:hypothetical protein